MNHLPRRPHRITIDFDDELKGLVENMAKKRNFSFSYMCYVLLQYAVKEKLRKKKPSKENYT